MTFLEVLPPLAGLFLLFANFWILERIDARWPTPWFCTMLGYAALGFVEGFVIYLVAT